MRKKHKEASFANMIRVGKIPFCSKKKRKRKNSSITLYIGPSTLRDTQFGTRSDGLHRVILV